jgi:outer membrane protein TolC
MAERMLEAAEETLRMSRERRTFGVGSVLETLSAEEELTRARLDFVALVAEANRAQLVLQRAIGGAPEKESGSDVMPRN